jgi:hypothetical protein
LPQHAVSRPPAGRKLEVTSGAYERRDCKGRLRAVFVYSRRLFAQQSQLPCTAPCQWRGMSGLPRQGSFRSHF